MITSLLLLPRLHRQWRRRLTLLVCLMSVSALHAQAVSGSSATNTTTTGAAGPIASAPSTTFTVGSPQIATATGAPLANLGAGLTAVQSQAAYAQYTALQNQLLDARRQAVLAAAQAPDDASRAKVWGAYRAAQKDNLALLLQLHAQIIPLEKQARVQAAAARAAAPKVAAPPAPAAAAQLFSKLASAK